MVSFNHYALGAVAEFLHKVVGGLSPIEDGWKRILVKPQPGGTVTSASVSHISPYGRISCEWKIVDGKLLVEVDVPANCNASVVLPGRAAEEVGSGRHSFSEPYETDTRFPPTVSRPHFMPPITNTYVP